ncbi:MAG: hypothetical protein Kow0027_16620 [Saprospiraceae bacterium]
MKLASVAAIVLAANFFSSFLYSQDTGFYRNMKEKADFVFEGEILKSTGKWNTGRTMIYTEHEIRLTKVFKGYLRENSIRLVTLGGETAEGQFVIVGDALQLGKGQKGIFFAQEEPLGMLAGTPFREKQCFASAPDGFVAKQFNDHSSRPLGYGAMYQKEKYDRVLAELGEVIAQYEPETTENPFSDLPCDAPDFASSAEISLQNVEVTNGLQDVEFDVVIKASPQGIKFGKCDFSLTFPEEVFGSYIFQNGILTVTKEAVTQDVDYALSVADLAAGKVNVRIELANGSDAAYPLTGSEEKLFHCKMTVADPWAAAELTGSDFKLEGGVWYECERSLLPFRETVIRTEVDVVLPNFENLIGINYHIQKFYYRDLGAVRTLKFDIYASSGSSTLFNSAELYIDYGDAFNTDLVSASGVSVQMGQVLSTGSSSNYSVNFFDDASSSKTLRLELSTLVGQPPTLTLTPTPVHILSVTLLVDDCTDNAGIEWNDLTNNNGNTYLDGTDVFQYMPITYDGSLTSPICGCNLPDPVITGFSETQVRAGTGEELTIQGNNFGHTIVDGSSYIEVRDGDGSSSLKTKIPVVDILDWTNTAITFIVPSATVGNVHGPMASGGVKVFNECDDSNEEDMDVEYAVMNYRPSISERAYRLALEKQTANGIEFKFSDNVGTDEKALSKSAIETWCGETGIHWSHGETLQNYSQVDPTDGINLVVEIPSSQLPSGAVGAAAVVAGTLDPPDGPTYHSTCNGGKTYYVRNIDILINQSDVFDSFDASDQRIFLHEFGHAHMLNHAAKLFGAPGSQKLMYYTYDFSGAITSADLNGANTVFAASAALLGGGGDCPDPIDTHACTNSTHENGLADRITVSPVPFTDGLTIQCEPPLGAGTTISLFGTMGNKVLERQFDPYGTIQLERLGSLPSGVYFLHISNDGQYWSKKLIKTGSHE